MSRDKHIKKLPLTTSAQNIRGILLIFSILLLAFSAIFNSSPSTEVAATEISKQYSLEIDSGYVMEIPRRLDINPQNFIIEEFTQSSSRMLIWDFTGNNQNTIEIRVNDEIIEQNYSLSSEVAVFDIPIPSVVTITGVDEEVNYAVKFPERLYTMFNTVASNQSNEYQLSR
ncbi:hypothetical protein [Alkalihalobacillus trypoxylicola]|uniref:Uncharacterized protein n=1 Tax=Alkalihalobacillus trypoxylicola TaxID=519424 RepID=A0A161Q3E5_9BACI|nr:hypothetical protein [Alkalihalobacillus trypoxylicola]KYG30503.1 hypothetical protein AZF04_19685 [Alkalihalobacillus trypoxylicola]